MKIVSNGDDFTLFILNKYDIDLENIKKYIKNNVSLLKKKYRKSICGFYDVNVYVNKKIGMILEFKKDDELEFFRDVIDINVSIKKDSSIFLLLKELFLIDKFDKIYHFNDSFYIDVEDISIEEFYRVLEFSDFIYGENLDRIKGKFNLLLN